VADVDLGAFQALLGEEGQALLARLGSSRLDHASLLAVATGLRREHPPDLVAAALTQALLRQQARPKFGSDAARMYFTPDGLEQATRTGVAALRARRYAGSGARRVADLCCGVGGDTLALARAGLAVLAVDRAPLTCAVAAANAAAFGVADRVEIRCQDVTAVSLSGCDAAFLDPARRTSRGRVFDPGAYSPPWSFVTELAHRVPRTGVKVAPGIPHELVPEGAEAEWVSERGDVKEAALWFGDLATTSRRATLLPSGQTLTGTGREPPPTAPPRRYLYEPDGAVIRAHLVAEVAALLDARLLDPAIAYLTSDRLAETPLATPYEITDVLPFQLKRLRALLRERGTGTVTIKKRGSAIEPDQLRRQLRLDGPGSAIVVLTRIAGRPIVVLAQPVSTAARA
jgi:SAM-dependent methyltransferase